MSGSGSTVQGRGRWLFFAVETAVLGFAVSCAGPLPNGSTAALRGSGAHTLEARDLAPGRPLYESLVGRVSGLKMLETPSGCPAITLRSAVAASPQTAPRVYVNGTRTYGTCALRDVSPSDVARVEVYPPGAAPRAGFEGSGTGIILIFLRSG